MVVVVVVVVGIYDGLVVLLFVVVVVSVYDGWVVAISVVGTVVVVVLFVVDLEVVDLVVVATCGLSITPSLSSDNAKSAYIVLKISSSPPTEKLNKLLLVINLSK